MSDSILELVAKAGPYLATHGSTSPRLDAELLLADVLGIGRMELYLQFERPLSAAEVDQFRGLCRRRAGGEPVAYIRGHKEFMSIDLVVSPEVMIPRPETEILVEEALRLLAAPGVGRGARVLDVGTGAGAIAVAVAVHHPAAHVVATDISDAALAVARQNAERLELLDRVELRQADLADGLEGRYDLVLANLPYIDPDWPDAVTPEVAATEPGLALWGGVDGLELVARLLLRVPDLLDPGGTALLECDPRNATRLLALAAGHGEARVLQDLAGLDRVVVVAR